jgi:hypothetical protein
MRTSILIFSLLFLTLISCDNSRTEEQSKNDTPKALEDKSSSDVIVSKRGYEDFIESLYKELSDKTPDLKELEMQIDKLADSKSDSLEQFNKYDDKNKSYYQSAENHIEQIKDSVIKEKIKLLIQTSVTKYGSLISKHNDILNSIDKQTITLNDLHLILKITRTLPLIEKYQKDNLPTTKPLEEYSKQLNKTVQYADSLTKN